MSTDIVPDILARGITDSVKRAATEAPNMVTETRNLIVLARHCEYMLQEARAVETEVKELVKEGVEADALRRRCESELALIGQDLDAAANVLQLAQRMKPNEPSRPDAAQATQTVENVRQELVKIREVFLGYLKAINRPLPVDFWEKASGAAASSGPYIRVDRFEDLFGDGKD